MTNETCAYAITLQRTQDIWTQPINRFDSYKPLLPDPAAGKPTADCLKQLARQRLAEIEALLAKVPEWQSEVAQLRLMLGEKLPPP